MITEKKLRSQLKWVNELIEKKETHKRYEPTYKAQLTELYYLKDKTEKALIKKRNQIVKTLGD